MSSTKLFLANGGGRLCLEVNGVGMLLSVKIILVEHHSGICTINIGVGFPSFGVPSSSPYLHSERTFARQWKVGCSHFSGKISGLMVGLPLIFGLIYSNCQVTRMALLGTWSAGFKLAIEWFFFGITWSLIFAFRFVLSVILDGGAYLPMAFLLSNPFISFWMTVDSIANGPLSSSKAVVLRKLIFLIG